MHQILATLLMYKLFPPQVAQWKRIHQPMQETEEKRVRSMDGEDPLEEEMATHSSGCLKNHRDREAWQSME